MDKFRQLHSDLERVRLQLPQALPPVIQYEKQVTPTLGTQPFFVVCVYRDDDFSGLDEFVELRRKALALDSKSDEAKQLSAQIKECRAHFMQTSSLNPLHTTFLDDLKRKMDDAKCDEYGVFGSGDSSFAVGRVAAVLTNPADPNPGHDQFGRVAPTIVILQYWLQSALRQRLNSLGRAPPKTVYFLVMNPWFHATPCTQNLPLADGSTGIWRWCVELSKDLILRNLSRLEMDVAILSADSRNALFDRFPMQLFETDGPTYLSLKNPFDDVRAMAGCHPSLDVADDDKTIALIAQLLGCGHFQPDSNLPPDQPMSLRSLMLHRDACKSTDPLQPIVEFTGITWTPKSSPVLRWDILIGAKRVQQLLRHHFEWATGASVDLEAFDQLNWTELAFALAADSKLSMGVNSKMLRDFIDKHNQKLSTNIPNPASTTRLRQTLRCMKSLGYLNERQDSDKAAFGFRALLFLALFSQSHFHPLQTLPGTLSLHCSL